MCKKIKIQAYDLKSEIISGLKDSLKLYIQKSFGYKRQEDYNPQDYYILSCTQELDNGIYEFEIEKQIPLDSQVFVQLLGHTTYLKDPYFLHPTCTQINLLECMIECNKPIPFVFASSPKEINIGILKAYKKNNTARESQTKTHFMNHLNINTNLDSDINTNINTNTNLDSNSNTGIDKNTNTDLNTNLNLDSSLKMNTNTNQSTEVSTNTNLDSNANQSLNENTNAFLRDSTRLNNPHNEIYTIDTEQTIRLRAFVYEEQRTKSGGNITKNIKELSQQESLQIQWAFKVVEGTYLIQRKEPFPILASKQTLNTSDSKLTAIPQDYVELENHQGDSITLSLRDLFSDTFLDSLVGKNIIFFAYNKNAGIKIPTSGNGIQYAKVKGKDKKVGIHNAYTQYAIQDYQQDWKLRKITQDRIASIELKILQTRFSLEFDGEYLRFYENQRELKQWNIRGNTLNSKENDTKPIQEGEYTITTTYNPDSLDLKGIDLDLLGEQKERLKEDICKTLQMYNIQENLLIPLKVKYQKRILIVIERFKETTESTKARMNIFVDRKRVDRNGNILGEKTKQYEYYNPYFLPKENPYAYILERNGPDSIGGELKLRVPSGRYNVEWHKEIDVSKLTKEEKIPWNANTLNLKNDFVAQGRAILIHNGNTPKNSDGCLLINQNQVLKDKIEIDNILQAGKKDILAQQIKDKFTKAILGKMTSNLKEFMEKYIEIQIINHFPKE